MIKVNWRILLILGIGMLIGSGVAFYWGYQLKVESEPFSHIWILALGFAWVGSDLMQKAVNKKTNQNQ
ncbi:MAG: hypothetical protein IIB95_14270 [Candidatus Marinimicrobia bacterium]|nr:hypothetical protein [Candidatus Neomarinimicrobiota bacterium]